MFTIYGWTRCTLWKQLSAAYAGTYLWSISRKNVHRAYICNRTKNIWCIQVSKMNSTLVVPIRKRLTSSDTTLDQLVGVDWLLWTRVYRDTYLAYLVKNALALRVIFVSCFRIRVILFHQLLRIFNV